MKHHLHLLQCSAFETLTKLIRMEFFSPRFGRTGISPAAIARSNEDEDHPVRRKNSFFVQKGASTAI